MLGLLYECFESAESEVAAVQSGGSTRPVAFARTAAREELESRASEIRAGLRLLPLLLHSARAELYIEPGASPRTPVKRMANKPVHVTDAEFDKVVKENPYVVVDFWAEWCAPCRAIAPTIEELAKKYDGKVTFAKVNSDENPKTVQQFMIMGIPTLLFFKAGKLVDQVVGAMPRGPLEDRVKKHLA
jgi:thioredoxin